MNTPKGYVTDHINGDKLEIAEQLGVSPRTVGYYGTPVYARRTTEKGRKLIEL